MSGEKPEKCPRCGRSNFMRTMTHYLCTTAYCRWALYHKEPIPKDLPTDPQ